MALYTDQLAGMIAAETGAGADSVEPIAVATALMGIHRALVADVRKRVLGGWRGLRLTADFASQANSAFALFEKGLAGYAVKADGS